METSGEADSTLHRSPPGTLSTCWTDILGTAPCAWPPAHSVSPESLSRAMWVPLRSPPYTHQGNVGTESHVTSELPRWGHCVPHVSGTEFCSVTAICSVKHSYHKMKRRTGAEGRERQRRRSPVSRRADGRRAGFLFCLFS